jgi:hypothetical protein
MNLPYSVNQSRFLLISTASSLPTIAIERFVEWIVGFIGFTEDYFGNCRDFKNQKWLKWQGLAA